MCLAWVRQSVQKSAQQKLLMRDSGKQPMIGRDRLSALRNSGNHAAGHTSSHTTASHTSAGGGGGHNRTGSGKLAIPTTTNSASNHSPHRQQEGAAEV